MNRNQTKSKPATPEQPTDEGLDETICSASFTPGPWHVVTIDGSIGSVEAEDGSPIAQAQPRGTLRNPNHDERRANARAIAAFPVVFAALERLEKTCNAVHEVSGGTPQHEAMWLAQLEARDALSEVTGIHWQNANCGASADYDSETK